MEVYECTHRGTLELGNKQISCAILKNKKRIITQTSLFDAFDRPRKGEKRLEDLPSILGAKNLLPFIDDELRSKAYPVKYHTETGAVKSGYDAELIPLVCEVYLKANDMGILHESQKKILTHANILIRSLAKVGIAALIDEATGYQQDREADELQKLLKLYIREDYLKWTARFPRKYYEELYRIHGWDYDPMSLKHPKYLGAFTNKYVYDQFPEGILNDLRKKNPNNSKGNRVRKHHQHLTNDFGIPHLEKHLTKLITIMELSSSKEQFKENFDRVFKGYSQPSLPFET